MSFWRDRHIYKLHTNIKEIEEEIEDIKDRISRVEIQDHIYAKEHLKVLKNELSGLEEDLIKKQDRLIGLKSSRGYDKEQTSFAYCVCILFVALALFFFILFLLS